MILVCLIFFHFGGWSNEVSANVIDGAVLQVVPHRFWLQKFLLFFPLRTPSLADSISNFNMSTETMKYEIWSHDKKKKHLKKIKCINFISTSQHMIFPNSYCWNPKSEASTRRGSLPGDTLRLLWRSCAVWVEGRNTTFSIFLMNKK